MSTVAEIQPRLLSTADAAKYLALSPSFIRKLVYHGELKPAIRLTKLMRFDILDLDAWVARQKGM